MGFSVGFLAKYLCVVSERVVEFTLCDLPVHGEFHLLLIVWDGLMDFL